MILLSAQLLLCVVHTQAYINLAFRKPAWQANNWPDPGKDVIWGANKSVDGQYSDRSAGGNQCAISGPGQQTATLRVDLQSVVSISHINIYYRTDNRPSPGAFYHQFAGFFLYVSNTTSKSDGQLCFHEIQKVNGTPTENQTISCPVHGRYVIYYNERRWGVTYPSYYSKYAYNNLCELEVYGCGNSGFYGDNCNQRCPENCQEQKCNITTGDCLGCIPGYQGVRCNMLCDKHTYGLECSSSCGNCSDGETCHHINGTCLKGCNAGTEGEKCFLACSPGSYGKNCILECSENCGVPRRCNRFNGECEGGCQRGWKGILCNKKCDGRMYGINCNQICGHCLNNAQCHHINGTCLEGCSAGYEGLPCVNECDQMTWGIDCTMNCSTECVNQTCQHVSGVCFISKQLLKKPKDTFSSLPVVVGVIAFVVVLTIVVMTVILLRRAKAREGKNSKQIKKSKKDQNSDGNTTTSPYAEIGALDKPNTYAKLGAVEKPNEYAELRVPEKPNTYTELGALEKPNTYEELHPYANT